MSSPVEDSRPPLQAGERAPDFRLATANREGFVSLADFRGQSSVLLALNRGLYCPFCRRFIAQLGGTCEKLRELGVETLAIVASELSRSRTYLRLRPTRVLVASDPELTTHRAFGLPRPSIADLPAVKINPTGELAEPLPVLEAGSALNVLDGFEMTTTDETDYQRTGPLITGQFLVDRAGVIRWASIEGASGPESIGRSPSEEELLALARALK